MRPGRLSILATFVLATCLAAPMSAQARGKPSALTVNCSQQSRGGFATIGAALTALRTSTPGGQGVINVTGACHENVVIQSMDRLTLNANAGASITDASGGSSDVIEVLDSRGVSINNFTINGGGITCSDGSFCWLNGNTVQNAAGAGVSVSTMSRAVVSGGAVRGGGDGIDVTDGSSAEVTGVTIANNAGSGIAIFAQSFVITDSIIENNAAGGAFITHNGVLRCLGGCQITNNGGIGVIARRDSSARFSRPLVTGNSGGGILITESSSVYFANPGTVTGNPGGMDVVCGSSFATAKQLFNIGGGTTNCVEPSE